MRALLLESHSKLAMHVTKKHLSDIQKSVDTQQERAGESLERKLERKPFTILLRVNADCQILFFLLCFQQCPVSQLILLNSLEV